MGKRGSGPGSGSRRGGKKGGRFPWWISAAIVVVGAALLGALFLAPPSPAQKRRQRSGEIQLRLKEIGKVAEAVAEGNFTGKELRSIDNELSELELELEGQYDDGKGLHQTVGNMRKTLLQQVQSIIAARLGKMSEIASAIENNDPDGESLRELEAMLVNMEDALEAQPDKNSDKLRAAMSIMRGTLLQQHKGPLTKEQEQKMKDSYTFESTKFWDEFYKEGHQHEWYGTWDGEMPETTFQPLGQGDPRTARSLGDLLRPYLVRTGSKILMFGCGNSEMSGKMCEDGFDEIVNIDISEELINNMRERHKKVCPTMEWLQMNASAMSFEDGTFDAIVDKGTLDAFGKNPELLRAAVRELHRTLRPTGFLLSITAGDERIRVATELKGNALWGACLTHPFHRKEKAERMYYLHACQRP